MSALLAMHKFKICLHYCLHMSRWYSTGRVIFEQTTPSMNLEQAEIWKIQSANQSLDLSDSSLRRESHIDTFPSIGTRADFLFQLL